MLRIQGLGLSAVLPVLFACASAGAQPPPQTRARASGEGALERLYVYEVPAPASATSDSGYVEVSGTGSVEIVPDRVRADFTVETRESSAEAAAERNARTMTAVMTALRSAGLPGIEIRTHSYRLDPVYAFPTVNGARTQRLDGYRVTNHIRVTIDDVDAAGRLIDLAIAAGSNRVASLSFLATATDDARRQALRLAVQQATAQAEALAEALGRRLGEPLQVRGSAQAPPPGRAVPFEQAVQARVRTPTPVSTGTQVVRASVTIRFRLLPAAEER